MIKLDSELLFSQKKLLKLLLFSYLLLTITRLLFLAFNYVYFKDFYTNQLFLAFFYALVFDTSTIFYFNSFLILGLNIPFFIKTKVWYNNLMGTVFMVSTLLLAVFNIIDIGYFPFVKKRTGSEFFYNANEIQSVAIDYIKDYWYLILILLLILIICLIFSKKVVSRTFYCENWGLSGYLTRFVLLLIWAGVFVIGVRGGITNLKPIKSFDVAKYVDAELVPLTLNTNFQIISTIGAEKLPEKKYFNQSEIATYFKLEKNYYNPSKTNKPNVVVIILESFGKEYIDFYNENKKGLTPFLDSICRISTQFPYSYANGLNSMQAVPSIIGGIPSLMDQHLSNSIYLGNNLCSFGNKLQDIGYTNTFYHGGKNGTMYFDSFIKSSSHGTYYGLNEYPNQADFDGKWGIPDHLYFNYVAEMISTQKPPFTSTIFSLSSHHPYYVPENLKNSLPKGNLEIHQSIAYTDYSLRLFFEKIKNTEWYNNTLFILTADHTSISETPRYQTQIGHYEVPIILFHPTQKIWVDTTISVQHIDIMPSILDYCNYPQPFYSFGESFFKKTSNKTVLNYESGTFIAVKYPIAYQYSNDKTQAIFDLNSDRLLKNNMIELKKSNFQNSENYIKAYIQTYNHALNYNKNCK